MRSQIVVIIIKKRKFLSFFYEATKKFIFNTSKVETKAIERKREKKKKKY